MRRCTAISYGELRCELVADHCCVHVARSRVGLCLWGFFAEVLRSLRGDK